MRSCTSLEHTENLENALPLGTEMFLRRFRNPEARISSNTSNIFNSRPIPERFGDERVNVTSKLLKFVNT